MPISIVLKAQQDCYVAEQGLCHMSFQLKRACEWARKAFGLNESLFNFLVSCELFVMIYLKLRLPTNITSSFFSY